MIAGVAATLAALACNFPGSNQPDVEGTLQTGVTQTLEALQTSGPATATPAAVASLTPLPPTIELSTATAVPTATVAAPTPSATVSHPIRPNGEPIHAPQREAALNIDGVLGDWEALPNEIMHAVFQAENWEGTSDQSASFAIAWDATYLYLAVAVQDDVHVQTESGETIFRGDSVEVLLDAKLQADHADTSLSADDFQIGFSPGGLGDSPEPDVYLWFPQARAGRPEQVRFAVQPDGDAGFTLEIAVPWDLFPITPEVGARFGFSVSVSDNDSPGTAEQQSMISVISTRALTDPTSWGTLVLEN